MFLGIPLSLDISPPCTILQMNFSCACFSISIKHDVDNPMRSSATCRYIYNRPRPPNENKYLGRDINHARFKRLRSIGHSGMFDICVSAFCSTAVSPWAEVKNSPHVPHVFAPNVSNVSNPFSSIVVRNGLGGLLASGRPYRPWFAR